MIKNDKNMKRATILAGLFLLCAGTMLNSCYSNAEYVLHLPPVVAGDPEPEPDPGTDDTTTPEEPHDDPNQWYHKDYTLLHEHTVGKGVIVCIVGDGFARKDNVKGGKWETTCRSLTDKLLENPIIRDFKDCFDVYMVVAESPKSGINKDNFFNSGGNGGADFEKANVFTTECIPGLAARFDRSFIFVGNGMIGGFANFGWPMGYCGSGVYSTDEAIGGYWMAHEFVGHAFASLADEYAAPSDWGEHYYGGADTLLEMQDGGICFNCSATDDPEQCPWADFIGRPGYEEVGLFEGGFGDPEGIWRPEEWTIMVDNRYGNEGDEALYYNAPSRWIIYQTIHKRAGLEYSFESFLEYDKAYNVK